MATVDQNGAPDHIKELVSKTYHDTGLRSAEDKRRHIVLPVPEELDSLDGVRKIHALVCALLVAGVPVEDLLFRLHSPGG